MFDYGALMTTHKKDRRLSCRVLSIDGDLDHNIDLPFEKCRKATKRTKKNLLALKNYINVEDLCICHRGRTQPLHVCSWAQ